MRIRLTALAAIVGAASVLPLLALANHVKVTDPNDTRGLLDVRRVTHSGGMRPVWTAITFSRWDVEEVFDYGYFLVRLDTFGSARFDYYGLVRSDGYRLKGSLVRDRASERDFVVGKLTAWHPDGDVVKLRIPLSKMRIGEKRFDYRWLVHSLFSSDRCPRVCIDDVPDRGAVEEPIPGRPRPLPTITPTDPPSSTPSLTPSP